MKRICLPISILIFIAAMLITGCGKKEDFARPQLPSAPPPSSPPAPPLVQAVPDEAPVFQAIATLEGSTRTDVRARVAGFLVRQDYHEGASVRPGDLLFELDARPFQAALDQARARLADKQAHAASGAELDAARTALTAAEVNLAATRIVAPVGGIAGNAVPGLGDWIEARTLLTTISTVDPIKAVFSLPKKFYADNADRIDKIRALAPDARPQTLVLFLADGTPYPHKGRWDAIDPGAPASNRPVTVSALFPNPDGALRPGEYVKVGEGGP
jgi:membrane fusion protein (multidrug efflux system)